MPRVSSYGEPQVGPVQATQARFRPADNGGGVAGAIAQGMQKAGAVINDHAQFLVEIKTEQEELAARDAANSFAMQIGEMLDNPETGLRSQRGRNAVDAYEPTLQRLQSAKSEIASGLSPMARKMFDANADERIRGAQSAVSVHVAREKEAWLDDSDQATIGIAQVDAGNAFEDLGVSNQHIATAVGVLNRMADRKGWDEATRTYQALKTISGARTDVANRLTDLNPDLAERYLHAYDGEFTPADRDHVTDEIRIRRSAILTEQRRAQTELRQQQREDAALVTEQARDVLEMVERGDEVDVPSLQRVATRLDQLGKPVLALRLRSAAEVQAVTTGLKAARPDEVQGWINKRRADTRGKMTPGDAAQIEAAEKLLGKMRTGIRNDPLSWAVQAGVATIAPVKLGDQASVNARIKTSLGVAERYGIKPAFFTDEETALLANNLGKLSGKAKLDAVEGIARGFGRYGRDVIGSLSGNDPVLAHAAGLAVNVGGGRDTAQRIFAGQEAWKSKAVAIPSVDAFNNAPGLGLALSRTPKSRGALIASAKAIYASEAVTAGLDPKVVDEDVWERSLNRAAGATYQRDGSRIGGISMHRGVNIVLPPTVAPDEFASLLGRIDASDLKAIGATPRYGNGKPVDVATLRSGYLFDASNGRYFVSLDRAGTQFLRGKNGMFVLDVGALVPRLRGRAPKGIYDTVTDWLGF